jgi:hypothetical protein
MNALAVMLKVFNVRHTTISVRHPQGNAHCERIMRWLNSSFTLLLPRYEQWPDYIDVILFVYRCSAHESLGLSPFFLQYGRHPV